LTATLPFVVEDVDLSELRAYLARTFEGSPPEGYMLGRTAMRDAVAAHLGCSLLEAEQLVDTLMARGFVRFDGSTTEEPDDLHPWILDGESPPPPQ
jgi:hypothetical protein